MKKLNLLTMGTASLFAAGAAMAAPPTGFVFGDYTVAGGIVTANACPAGYTCVGLAASGVGILQQQVNETATGKSYIRTIIVDDAATTAGNAIVGATYNLDFTNESFVGVTANTSGDLAVDNGVKLLAQGVNQGPAGLALYVVDANGGNNFMKSEIAQGNLANIGAPGAVKVTQRMSNAAAGGVNGNGQMDFVLLSNGSEADRYMRMDHRTVAVDAEVGGNPNAVTPHGLTVRRSSGSFTETGGTLTLPDGQTVAYNAGDDIGVVWLQLRAMGFSGLDPATTGSPIADPRLVQVQNYENKTTSTVAHWNSCNANGKGACVPVNTGTTWTYWDANFGTVPNPYDPVTRLAPVAFFPDFPN